MKPQYLLPALAITVCHACTEQPATVYAPQTPDYEKGTYFLKQNNKDSAFHYFNEVATTAKDSPHLALAYAQMGHIQYTVGDYYGSQENLLNSIGYLDKNTGFGQQCLQTNYSEIAKTYLELKDYDAAIRYIDLALELIQDSLYKTIALNIKAVAHQKKKQYNEAIAIYQSILGPSKKNKKEYARVLCNLSYTKWLKDRTAQVAPDLLRALHIRQAEKDTWGLNASYAHLSDYYASSHPDSALLYAHKMYATTQQINSPTDELEALQKLILLGPASTLKQYFTRYQYLDDSIKTARNAAKNQFAVIRYEAEKNKVENLRLQKENADKEVQLIKQSILLYGTASVSIMLFIGALRWYRKRKQKMLWESRNTIREHKLKTSQKVHDVVANGLYRIMTEIEHQDTIEKEPLLDKIEVLYEQSRDISYDQPEIVRHDFQDSITSLLSSFATPDTKILIVGNLKDLWTGIPTSVKKELEHVLQELMVNMKKHSKARTVVIKFEQQDNQAKIQYTDDGVGLPPNFRYGNGLTNTGNRIKNMGGRIIFDQNLDKGLKIEISLPTSTIQV